MKKSYYNLARRYHPDRVEVNEKANASKRFNIVHQAYLILSNTEKKNKYDEGCEVFFFKATVTARWEYYLKPVTMNDMNNARETYKGSTMEKEDIAKAFKDGNGSLTFVLNNIPFMRLEDESRVIGIINEMISDGLVPKIRIKKMRK